MNELDKRMDCVKLAQATLAKENGVLRDKVMYLENYTRKQNIQIVGIKENAEGPKPTSSGIDGRTRLSTATVLGQDPQEFRPHAWGGRQTTAIHCKATSLPDQRADAAACA